MPYEIGIDGARHMVTVHHHGLVTLDEVAESRQRFSRICRERGWTKILIDCLDLTQGLSTIDLYEVATSNREKGLTWSMTQAFVVPEMHWEAGLFYQTVSENRAFKVHLFRDRESALHWLDALEQDGLSSTG